MDFTVLWNLHRNNQSVQKLLPTRSSPVLCHELAKAAHVRFRLSIQPAGCDADTCAAKVNSNKRRFADKSDALVLAILQKLSDCEAEDFQVPRGRHGKGSKGDIRERRSPYIIVAMNQGFRNYQNIRQTADAIRMNLSVLATVKSKRSSFSSESSILGTKPPASHRSDGDVFFSVCARLR
jgi:hypothetical protein